MRIIRVVVALLLVAAASVRCTVASTSAPTPVSTPPSIDTSCGSDEEVAVTNGVSVTVNRPRNTGDCPLTLSCRDKEHKIVGATKELFPGGSTHSFSCGAGAERIWMSCRQRQTSERRCKLEWLP